MKLLGRCGCLALALLVCHGSCGGGQPVPETRQELKFERIAQGDWFAGAGTRGETGLTYRLLHEASEWSRFWQQRFVGDVPTVSFRGHVVIAVFQGDQATGGYGVDVVRAFKAPGENVLHLALNLQEPRPDEGVDLGETSPYVIVKVALPDAAARALDRSRLRVALHRIAESSAVPVEATPEKPFESEVAD